MKGVIEVLWHYVSALPEGGQPAVLQAIKDAVIAIDDSRPKLDTLPVTPESTMLKLQLHLAANQEAKADTPQSALEKSQNADDGPQVTETSSQEANGR